MCCFTVSCLFLYKKKNERKPLERVLCARGGPVEDLPEDDARTGGSRHADAGAGAGVGRRNGGTEVHEPPRATASGDQGQEVPLRLPQTPLRWVPRTGLRAAPRIQKASSGEYVSSLVDFLTAGVSTSAEPVRERPQPHCPTAPLPCCPVAPLGTGQPRGCDSGTEQQEVREPERSAAQGGGAVPGHQVGPCVSALLDVRGPVDSLFSHPPFLRCHRMNAGPHEERLPKHQGPLSQTRCRYGRVHSMRGLPKDKARPRTCLKRMTSGQRSQPEHTSAQNADPPNT